MSHRGGESERQRIPQPVIKHRIASGRGAMEQPNVTNDGDAALTARFWIVLVIASVLTGLMGDALMAILKFAERLAFNYHGGDYAAAAAATPPLHRVVVLTLAGIIGAVCWFGIRKWLKHQKSEVDDVLWRGDARLGVMRSTLTSVVSEIVIGMGGSIGREAAPKLMGGVAASWLSDHLAMTDAQRRLLVACAGGAGLACVYNVPIGGAIFTAEVLYGSFALPTALAALASSAIATMTAWLLLPTTPVYGDLPTVHTTPTTVGFALVAGVLIGGLAICFIRLIGWVSAHRIGGTKMLFLMPATFAVVGVIGIWFPQIFGNGKDMAHDAFLGTSSIGLLLALSILKPLVTAGTLGSGAAGGVFTPFLATGAVTGALFGTVWLHLWGGAPVTAFALIGASAMIGAAMQAPMAGMVLVMELTHSGLNVAIPMVLATVIATALVRWVDGYSIYSARLPQLNE